MSLIQDIKIEELTERIKYLEKALYRIGFYCLGTDFSHVSDFVLRVKSGQEIL